MLKNIKFISIFFLFNQVFCHAMDMYYKTQNIFALSLKQLYPLLHLSINKSLYLSDYSSHHCGFVYKVTESLSVILHIPPQKSQYFFDFEISNLLFIRKCYTSVKPYANTCIKLYSQNNCFLSLTQWLF